MGKETGIAWCSHTFNPWRGCTKVSPGCANCYAETLSARNPKVLGTWGPNGMRVIASESYWWQPLKWNAEAKAAGERRRVFCLSLGDFAEARPELVGPRMRLFQLIGRTLDLDWLLLTKRPEVALENWPLWCGYWASVQEDMAIVQQIAQNHILPNVWLGISVEDQQRADERIPLLLKTPAAVRFLSCEPLLELVDLSDYLKWECPKCGDTYLDADADWCWPGGELGPMHFCGVEKMAALARPRIGWVIVGAESGHGARPCHLSWIRSIMRQCESAGVACFVKQLGKHPIPQDADDSSRLAEFLPGWDAKGGDWDQWPADLHVRQFPEVAHA